MNDCGTPGTRVRQLNPAVVTGDGLYVAYWMVSSRRTFWSPALQRAAAWARELRQSLLVCEPLRLDQGGGQLRSHRFLLDGMVSNSRRLAYAGVLYHPFVESPRCREDGLLEAVAKRASVWITDHHPSTDLGDLAHLTRGTALPVRAEAVDGESVNAVSAVPESATKRGQGGVRVTEDLDVFRSRFRSTFLESLREAPERNPLAKFSETHLPTVLPHITVPWPAADGLLLAGAPGSLEELGLSKPDPFRLARGGSDAAFENWRELIGALSGADSDGTPRVSRPPLPETTSGTPRVPGPPLSAALREATDSPDRQALVGFHLAAGHISGFQVLAESLRHCRWTPASLGQGGQTPADWWGLPGAVADLMESVVVHRDWELAKIRGVPPS